MLDPKQLDAIKQLIQKHWGFSSLRPFQEDAMRAVLDRRDSLLVLPTGGGKSLCYQAPAVFQGGTTVVISPLIALMKDQVDALQSCGIPAVQLDSSLSAAERFAHAQDVRDGAVRLLFVSPERLMELVHRRPGATFSASGVLRLEINESERERLLEIARDVLLAVGAVD